jgi:sulfoxide reductase heme-binding subunit YedZ
MSSRPRKAPWLDRAGRLSLLKTVVFVALFAPGAAAAVDLADGAFMAEPAKQVVHALGLWAVRLILLSLLVTPAMQIFRLPKLLLVRRMIGVAAFTYAFAHLVAYVAMENFDLAKVASEIWLRFYLTIGFVALLMLTALAATSTDAMIRRMGARRWQLLHRLVYVIGVLALVHYFIQAKLVVTEPTIFTGLFLWLMAYRFIMWRSGARVVAQPAALLGLALAASALTMGGEALGYTLLTPVDGMKVFQANFTFIAGIRPGWYVLMVGVAIALAAVVRGWVSPAPQRRATVAA